MKILNAVLLLSIAVAFGQNANDSLGQPRRDGSMNEGSFKWAWAKGGIGAYDTHLYVVTRSGPNDRNALVYRPKGESETKWSGKSTPSPEIVIIYDGKVWSSGSIPDQYDMSESIVISFEKDKIRIFDFSKNKGVVYNRVLEP